MKRMGVREVKDHWSEVLEQVETKGGTVLSHADTNHEISGAAVKSEGSATNTIKGGMVMLNP